MTLVSLLAFGWELLLAPRNSSLVLVHGLFHLQGQHQDVKSGSQRLLLLCQKKKTPHLGLSHSGVKVQVRRCPNSPLALLPICPTSYHTPGSLGSRPTVLTLLFRLAETLFPHESCVAHSHRPMLKHHFLGKVFPRRPLESSSIPS